EGVLRALAFELRRAEPGLHMAPAHRADRDGGERFADHVPLEPHALAARVAHCLPKLPVGEPSVDVDPEPDAIEVGLGDEDRHRGIAHALRFLPGRIRAERLPAPARSPDAHAVVPRRRLVDAPDALSFHGMIPFRSSAARASLRSRATSIRLGCRAGGGVSPFATSPEAPSWTSSMAAATPSAESASSRRADAKRRRAVPCLLMRSPPPSMLGHARGESGSRARFPPPLRGRGDG